MSKGKIDSRNNSLADYVYKTQSDNKKESLEKFIFSSLMSEKNKKSKKSRNNAVHSILPNIITNKTLINNDLKPDTEQLLRRKKIQKKNLSFAALK